ncbi:MAG TPA: DUF362 domain-containing protein [Candidatus Latescibacteria bacterium]|jgi:hypothetical protein|nr:DUF362 domain-containing protein [Candidatus Latescibacterota bacterium]
MARPNRHLSKTIGRFLLPITGLLSLLWFLIRVVPRPSRAAYPCQVAAFPMASAFVLWMASVVASWSGLRLARVWFVRGRSGLAGIALLASLVAGSLALMESGGLAGATVLASRFEPSEGPNQPMGAGRGIFPGRVVWIHEPEAAKWDGVNGQWWTDDNTDPVVVAQMLSDGLQSLTGTSTDGAAWSALFHHFNRTHDRGDMGYQAGERIAAKFNFNQTSARSNGNESFTGPQLTLAYIRQLVEAAGVPDTAITIYDATRYAPKLLIDAVHAEYPGVRFVSFVSTSTGNIGHERGEEIAFSQPLTLERRGGNPTYVPRAADEATYVVNVAIMKGHDLSGVTLTAKNLFGSISADYASGERTNNAPVAAGLHPYTAVRDFGAGASGSGDWDFAGRDLGTYNPLVDLIGHRDLGGKTLLYVADALYSTRRQNEHLSNGDRFTSEPFSETGWPSSLFLSQDPLAIDSVCLDFLRAEPTQFNVYGNVDNYLHEAARAHDPPSGITYDPEGDGTTLGSLGVHEHWNNPVDRQYSGNLGLPGGIELYVPGVTTAVTEVGDAATTPSTWSLSGYPNPFNPTVTVSWSQPVDGAVHLAVFDAIGQRVVVLHEGDTSAGSYEATWDGTDDAGRPLASGVYMVLLSRDGQRQRVTRLTLMR